MFNSEKKSNFSNISWRPINSYATNYAEYFKIILTKAFFQKYISLFLKWKLYFVHRLFISTGGTT